MQDFSLIDSKGRTESKCVGKLPYEGNEDEMIVMEANADFQQITLVFCLHNDFERFEKKSLNLIYSLINHKGEGSLYQCLRGLNYITNIELTLNNEIFTAFRFITIQAGLTEEGIINFRKVLALILRFFSEVTDKWLASGEELDLFKECQTISALSY